MPIQHIRKKLCDYNTDLIFKKKLGLFISFWYLKLSIQKRVSGQRERKSEKLAHGYLY